MIENEMVAERAKQMKTSRQLMLIELILKLEAVENKELYVVFDGEKYHPVDVESWRGSYCELALSYDSEFVDDKHNVYEFIAMLKEAMGSTLVGYKGGEYLMGKTTPVWVANYGNTYGFKQGGDTDSLAVVGVSESETEVVIETETMDY